jgi:hypothetical protein
MVCDHLAVIRKTAEYQVKYFKLDIVAAQVLL